MNPSVTLPPARLRWIEAAKSKADAVLADFAPGARVAGVTKGQFGLTDLVVAALAHTGPCDLFAWSWTLHPDDAGILAQLRDDGMLRRVAFVLDTSFPARVQLNKKKSAGRGGNVEVNDWCAHLEGLFGEDAFTLLKSHAKVVCLANAKWHLTITSSMNFNMNRRVESFCVEDDAQLWAHWRDLTRWAWAHGTPGLSKESDDPTRSTPFPQPEPRRPLVAARTLKPLGLLKNTTRG